MWHLLSSITYPKPFLPDFPSHVSGPFGVLHFLSWTGTSQEAEGSCAVLLGQSVTGLPPGIISNKDFKVLACFLKFQGQSCQEKINRI